ncbi:MAG TPA: PDDEXK nuclease domain-containing protein [Bacteroidota bacterium]|nr:PDDEXK nuclease domain-containing protein [Bacteroidota bacterium]
MIGIESLYSRIKSIIEEARTNVLRTVNTEMVRAYWLIGRELVEVQQKGKGRAPYGKELLGSLADRLHGEFGKGFTSTNLKYMRLLFLTYPRLLSDKKGHAVRDESAPVGILNPNLAWTHYRLLTKIDSSVARSFYEIEATKNRWSSRELDRQMNSLLYERLAKSRQKKEVLALARRGQEIQKPEDAIKDPFVLEFLKIPETPRLVESKLEEALLNNLQQFLLELGRGFSFIDRQQRLTLDGDHFYVDLVFYHAILKCYVLIDLKVTKLMHGDLGQMQLYVNYYDEHRRTEGDNPTVGLILCTDKNEAVVRYMLGKGNRRIFVSRYKLHLPTEEELIRELRRELSAMSKPR